jgi:hypothetical protein
MKKSVFVFLVFVFLGTDFIFTQNKIHEVKLSGKEEESYIKNQG